MKLMIYAVRDNAVGAFLRPFFMQANGQAIRAFSDEVNGDSPMAKHPEDYSLWSIGAFDEATGVIEAAEHQTCMVKAVDVRVKENA